MNKIRFIHGHHQLLGLLVDPLNESFKPEMVSALLELRADSELEAFIGELRHWRWEIGSAMDESKTHRRGSRFIPRSKLPNLVRQEFHGFMMARFAVGSLTHAAALRAHLDSRFCTPCESPVVNCRALWSHPHSSGPESAPSPHSL